MSYESSTVLSGHKGCVWNVSWNPQGTALASCSTDKTIRIWSKDSNGQYVCKNVLSEGHSRTIRSTSWSPCGNFLASASFDATVNIWERDDENKFECIATLEGHENEVKSVNWSVSGSFLATCSRDKSVWVWEVTDDKEYECVSVLPAHTQDVKKIIFHPNADLLVSCSYDNTINLYKPDDDDWIVSDTIEGHSSTVWSLSFDADGKRLASCSDDRTVKIWQEYLPDNKEGIETKDKKSTWKCVSTLSGYHDRPIYDIDWCKLTSLIATACGDNYIKIFKENPVEGTFDLVLSVPLAHSGDVNSVAWNPVLPGILTSASDDETIKIWDFSSLF